MGLEHFHFKTVAPFRFMFYDLTFAYSNFSMCINDFRKCAHVNKFLYDEIKITYEMETRKKNTHTL